MLRASVVSTCLTTSFSKSSLSTKGLAWNFCHAARCGSGIEAVDPKRYQLPLLLIEPQQQQQQQQPCQQNDSSKRWGRLQKELPSTLLISPAPKPVKVRLCFGLENPGPTGPCRSEMGVLVEARRSRLGDPGVAIANCVFFLCNSGYR